MVLMTFSSVHVCITAAVAVLRNSRMTRSDFQYPRPICLPLDSALLVMETTWYLPIIEMAIPTKANTNTASYMIYVAEMFRNVFLSIKKSEANVTV